MVFIRLVLVYFALPLDQFDIDLDDLDAREHGAALARIHRGERPRIFRRKSRLGNR